MAEETFVDVIVNNLINQTDVGGAVYPGLSALGDDLEDYMPFIVIYLLPIGKTKPGNHGGGLNDAYVSIESWDVDDLTEARRRYKQARDYILENNQMPGTNYNVDMYEFQAMEDDTGYETKHFVARGAWKVIWSPK